MCLHQPPCPVPDASDCEAARPVVQHPEQGWSLLCNGVVLLDDTGAIRPDGESVAPHRFGRSKSQQPASSELRRTTSCGA
ncbi:DUF5999 family protein [Streptomyces decoyicus]